MTGVKICGLKDKTNLKTAIDAGADFVGFVFYTRSPRFVEFDNAWHLARSVPKTVHSVGLFVNPQDEELMHIVGSVRLDMIQLHDPFLISGI